MVTQFCLRQLVEFRLEKCVLGQVRTCALVGIEAVAVDVEVLTRSGRKESFQIVGLGDSAVREARGRVMSALQRGGFTVPDVIFVNLAPAEVKKEGAGFDLAIAIGVLCSSQQIKAQRRREIFFFGELSLDGSIKPVRGVIALAISAFENGARIVVVPQGNVAEARLVSGLNVFGVATLREAIGVALGDVPASEVVEVGDDPPEQPAVATESLAQVRGQSLGKRAMMVAAAGGHNLIFVGPPGCGKSMLAQRFANILPPLNASERFEAVKIHSIAGLPVRKLLSGVPPFRSPHHVVSDVGLVGGGATPKPGEISLAHRGVLFLDEFPEYRRSALEAMRAPLETGQVRISRAKGSALLPARFQLIAAMNPCPCGRLGSQQNPCVCSDSMLQMYLRRLSQPILERIDIQVELEEVVVSDLTAPIEQSGEFDRKLRDQVIAVREMQQQRQAMLNSRLEGEALLAEELIDPHAVKLLEQTAKRNLVSARSFIRILRIARTIADIEQSVRTLDRHVAEAISFRVLDRRRGLNGVNTP